MVRPMPDRYADVNVKGHSALGARSGVVAYGSDGFADERRQGTPRRGEKNDKRVQRSDSSLVVGSVRRQRLAGFALELTEEAVAVPEAGEVHLAAGARLVQVDPQAACEHVAAMGIAAHRLLAQPGTVHTLRGCTQYRTRLATDEVRDLERLRLRVEGAQLNFVSASRPMQRADDDPLPRVAGTPSTYFQYVT